VPRLHLVPLALLLATGCASDDTVEEPAPEVAWPQLACDPLVPSYCGYPYPSNVFTVEDAEAVTGRRVSFVDGSLPAAKSGYRPSFEALWPSDGFSPGAAIMAEMPGALSTGFPTSATIELSLSAESPSVLVEAETGERVPHFTELDFSGSPQTLMIRPVERLKDGTRYIVALRNVQGPDGPIAPSAGFAALRDLKSIDDPDVEGRRGLYADIFGRLEAAGVMRGDLQLAWDFTTASRENNTRFMVHMRDEALAMVGEDGPAYTITNVEADPDPRLAFRLEGTMTAPLYLTQADPGGRLVMGDDGLPEPNPQTPTREVPWRLLIPKSAETTPAALLQLGTGCSAPSARSRASKIWPTIMAMPCSGSRSSAWPTTTASGSPIDSPGARSMS